MDVVKIVWADAHAGEGGWQELDHYADDGEELVTTVGFLVAAGQPSHKTGHVSVWQSIAGREGIHPFHIPTDMVRNIVTLCCVETLLD